MRSREESAGLERSDRVYWITLLVAVAILAVHIYTVNYLRRHFDEHGYPKSRAVFSTMIGDRNIEFCVDRLDSHESPEVFAKRAVGEWRDFLSEVEKR